MNNKNLINANELETEFTDLLDREKLADNFVKVVCKQNAKVYSVNAPWGGGKTCFLKLIEKSCKNHDIPFIQYNIWETDYLDNPLKSILNEFLNLTDNIEYDKNIFEEIKCLGNVAKDTTSELWEFIKQLGFQAGASMAMPTQNGICNLKLDVSKPAETLDEYEKIKKLKMKIKKNLQEILSKIPDKKIIIAIDELDRCRPNYAIRTLEIIKHFFDLDKLVFILAVDKEQLKNTVKVLYGLDAKTDCYLKKFVDVEYTLPKPKVDVFINYLIENKYKNILEKIQYFNNNYQILLKTEADEWRFRATEEKGYIIAVISELVEYHKMELRDIEKFVLKFSIVIDNLNANGILCLPFLLDLIILNTSFNSIFNSLKKNDIASIRDFIKGSRAIKTDTITITRSIYESTDNIFYDYRNDLKKYFDLIELAQNFDA